MEVDGQAPEPRRVPELWFEDGNVVIQAGNTQYRVYRGVLVRQSPVFQDMFSVPQPPDSELVDGCAFVRLTDSEEEVTSFLKAIFHPAFFMSFPAPTELHVVVGCLRLAHKYGIDYLRRHALIHLSSGFRTTLGETEAATYVGDEDVNDYPASDIRSCTWPDNWTYLIAVIQLAREVDAPWILPYAFYKLAAAYPHIFGGDVYHGVVYSGASITLSAQDQQAFARGHCKQIICSSVDILRFLTHPPTIDDCENPQQCISKRLQILEDNREALRNDASEPLSVGEWGGLETLCYRCRFSLRGTHDEVREAFWRALPALYSLPPWEELERVKAAAIGTNLFG